MMKLDGDVALGKAHTDDEAGNDEQCVGVGREVGSRCYCVQLN